MIYGITLISQYRYVPSLNSDIIPTFPAYRVSNFQVVRYSRLFFWWKIFEYLSSRKSFNQGYGSLQFIQRARVAQWVRYLDYRTTQTSLSPIRHGFAPGFVNYKKRCTRLAAASDKAYQLLAHGRWFSLGTPASSTTNTGRHDIDEKMLKVALKHQKIKSIHPKRTCYSQLVIHYGISVSQLANACLPYYLEICVILIWVVN